jgi:hypothetical protein
MTEVAKGVDCSRRSTGGEQVGHICEKDAHVVNVHRGGARGRGVDGLWLGSRRAIWKQNAVDNGGLSDCLLQVLRLSQANLTTCGFFQSPQVFKEWMPSSMFLIIQRQERKSLVYSATDRRPWVKEASRLRAAFTASGGVKRSVKADLKSSHVVSNFRPEVRHHDLASRVRASTINGTHFALVRPMIWKYSS